MTVEFTARGRLWVGGNLQIDTDVVDAPGDIFRFANDARTAVDRHSGYEWEMELDPGEAEPVRWNSSTQPSTGVTFVQDVVYRFVELRHRETLGERQEE